ncbi:unnamed protein product [Absidia cylindrospora]
MLMMAIPLVLRMAWLRSTLVMYLSYDLFFPLARAPVDLFALCLIATTLIIVTLDRWQPIARFFWVKHHVAWHVAFPPAFVVNNDQHPLLAHHFRSKLAHFHQTLDIRLRRAHRLVEEPTRLLDERLEKSNALIKDLYLDYVVSILMLWLCHTRQHTFSYA